MASRKSTPAPLSKLRAAPRRSELLGLRELREIAGFTQIQLAEKLNKAQSELSKLERRDDFYVSTLKDYVHALGGEIELVVQLQGREFRIRGL